ncbi:MAG TPA: hypothetical protein VK510_03140 [Solirubrobacteraceae bacterium]|nr:hypothetical protein [Solirubrobacteraceae bacterium]
MDAFKTLGRSAAGELAASLVSPSLASALTKAGVPMADTVARFGAAAAGVYAAGIVLGKVGIVDAVVLGVVGTLVADAASTFVPIGPASVKRAVAAGAAGLATTWARAKI